LELGRGIKIDSKTQINGKQMGSYFSAFVRKVNKFNMKE